MNRSTKYRRLLFMMLSLSCIAGWVSTNAAAQARRPEQEQSGIPESSYQPGKTPNGELETNATPPPSTVIHSTATLDGSGAYGKSSDKQ